jgi:hypothetical protein
MKYITLVASEMVDGGKVELGRIEKFPVPQTVDEVVGMADLDDGCNDDEIVSCFNYGWKVKSQAKLRSGADPKSPASIFKKLSKERQDEILKKEGLL